MLVFKPFLFANSGCLSIFYGCLDPLNFTFWWFLVVSRVWTFGKSLNVEVFFVGFGDLFFFFVGLDYFNLGFRMFLCFSKTLILIFRSFRFEIRVF